MDSEDDYDGEATSISSVTSRIMTELPPVEVQAAEDNNEYKIEDVPNCPECSSKLKFWCPSCEDVYVFNPPRP